MFAFKDNRLGVSMNKMKNIQRSVISAISQFSQIRLRCNCGKRFEPVMMIDAKNTMMHCISDVLILTLDPKADLSLFALVATPRLSFEVGKFAFIYLIFRYGEVRNWHLHLTRHHR